MVAQTVAGEGVARILGPWGEGLTFGKRQRRNGRGCWGRSCGGCPGDCYLWQKEGESSGLGRAALASDLLILKARPKPQLVSSLV